MIAPTTLPVVVAVDGRPGSAGAVRYAVAEATRRSTSLQLVHVAPSVLSLDAALPSEDLHRVGATVLDETSATVRGLAPDLLVTTLQVSGDRCSGLVRAADGAQLVVVGRESRHGVERLLSGAVTAGVAAQAPCDVVVVPSTWLAHRPHGTVVAGVKSHRHTHELLTQAFREAEARDATLVAVTAWHVADPCFDRIEARTHSADREERGRALLEEAVAEVREDHPTVPVVTKVVHGPAARVLLDESSPSDLLVVARRRLAVPPYGHLGSVGHAVLRLSDVPVHVVPLTEAAPVAGELVLEREGVPLR